MSMLRYGVGLALRRSAPAAAVSRLLGSGNNTVGVAQRRSTRLSHPPPSAASFRFNTTGESSKTMQLQNRVGETKGELMDMNVRMHSKDLGARDAAKVHCKDHAAKVKVESNQALAKFQGRMGSAMEERSSTKQIVKEATVSSGSGGGGRKKYQGSHCGGRKKYQGRGSSGDKKFRDHKAYLDRVVAPVSFGLLMLYIFVTSCKYK